LNADGSGEVREKNSRTLEHTNQQYGFASEIAVNLRTQLSYAIRDSIAADENRWLGGQIRVANRRCHTVIFSQALVFFQR
jgi:hypothetical protein